MSTARDHEYTPQCLISTLFLSKLPSTNFSKLKMSHVLFIHFENVQFLIKLALQINDNRLSVHHAHHLEQLE